MLDDLDPILSNHGKHSTKQKEDTQYSVRKYLILLSFESLSCSDWVMPATRCPLVIISSVESSSMLIYWRINKEKWQFKQYHNHCLGKGRNSDKIEFKIWNNYKEVLSRLKLGLVYILICNFLKKMERYAIFVKPWVKIVMSFAHSIK